MAGVAHMVEALRHGPKPANGGFVSVNANRMWSAYDGLDPCSDGFFK